MTLKHPVPDGSMIISANSFEDEAGSSPHYAAGIVRSHAIEPGKGIVYQVDFPRAGTADSERDALIHHEKKVGKGFLKVELTEKELKDTATYRILPPDEGYHLDPGTRGWYGGGRYGPCLHCSIDDSIDDSTNCPFCWGDAGCGAHEGEVEKCFEEIFEAIPKRVLSSKVKAPIVVEVTETRLYKARVVVPNLKAAKRLHGKGELADEKWQFMETTGAEYENIKEN